MTKIRPRLKVPPKPECPHFGEHREWPECAMSCRTKNRDLYDKCKQEKEPIKTERMVTKPSIVKEASPSSPISIITFKQTETEVRIETNEPLEIFNQLLKRHIRVAQDEVLQLTSYTDEEEVEDQLKEVELKVARKHYDAHQKAVVGIEKEYGKNALWNKDPVIPFRTTWLHPDKKNISKEEKRKRELVIDLLDRKTRFSDVYNYLFVKTLETGDHSFPEQYTETGRAWPYAIVRINQSFYNNMIEMLSIGQKDIS